MAIAPEIEAVDQLRQRLAQNGYRVVPVKSRQKAPAGFAWQTVARRGDVPKASPATLNTGVLCDGLRVVDIDIDDVDIVCTITSSALDLLGVGPIRTRRNSGRRTIVYRAEEGEPKKRIISGTAGKVEVLGHGQQFVAFGIHPSNAEFEWLERSLLDVPVAELPAICEDAVTQFLNEVAPLIGAEPRAFTPVQKARLPPHPLHGSSELEDLLAFIDAGCSYEDWVQVLMGIHHETGGSAEGLRIADRWSSGGGNYSGPKSVEAKWRSFHSAGGVTISTIAHLAQQRGADLAAIAAAHGRASYDDVSPETLREWQEVSDRLWSYFQKKAGLIPRVQVVPPGFDPETGEELGGGTIDPLATTLSTHALDMADSDLHPPGLVGEVADWICSWTAEPIRIHAIGAALVVLGTLLGRKVYSRTRPTSTALYIGAIAPSGMGKQHPQDAIRMVLQEVTGGNNRYSGWAQSLPKLVMDLQTNASRVMVADEFADKLIGLRSRNASTSQSAISEGLRSLWGTNTGTYSPDTSISRGDANIMRPCFSFYGAATVKDFARALVSKDVTNGLFNRFLILPRYGRVQKKDEAEGAMALPALLKDRLTWLDQCLPPIQLAQADRGDGHPANPVMVPLSAEAQIVNEANRAHQEAMMIESDADDALMLWARFAEQVKRVALIVACGRCPEEVTSVQIEAEDMAWATTLVRYSIEQFIGIVRRDMVENQVEANRQKVLGTIRSAKGGVIKKFELLRRVRSIRAKEIDDIIGMLVQAECIEHVEITGDGRTAKGYRFLHD